MSLLKDDWQKIMSVIDDKGIALDVSYSYDAHKFRVDVSHGTTKLSEEFNALYTPVLGMDIDDHQQAMEIAERLAVKIEQDLGL